MDKNLNQLGEVQKEVMEIVWKLGEASVHDVINELNREKKPAYTTILTVMQVLERKGWLTHRREGGTAYLYQPAFSRGKAQTQTLSSVIAGLFKGDNKALFQHLLEETELSENDLTDIKKMIDQHRHKRKEK